MKPLTRPQRLSLPLMLLAAALMSALPLAPGCSKKGEQPASAPAAQPSVAANAAQPAPAPPQASAQPGSAPGAATPEQLQELVSPIALYPDVLLAQMLAGSNYPDQIVEAARWLKQNPSLSGDQLAAQVNPQPWDPSIKSLTQFPSVLQTMSDNLSWTSALGEAYYNQPTDVMNAIQVMRNRAVAAGTLKSTPQQKVEVQAAPPALPAEGGEQAQPAVQQTVIVQPAQPDTVYVPQYNPTTSYGAPVTAPPGYSGSDLLLTGVVSFGAGMLVGSLINDGDNDWGCDWHGGGGGHVNYNNNVYVNKNNVYAGRNYNGGAYGRSGNPPRPVPYAGGRPGYGASGYNRPGGIPATRPYNPDTARQFAGNNPNIGKPNFPNTNTLPGNRGGSNLNGRNPSGNRPNQPGNSRPSTRPANRPPNRPSDSARGRGNGRDSTGGRNGALGGYEPGGKAQAESGRGRSSLNGNQFAGGGRGGGAGGGKHGGGGGGGGGRRGGGGGGGRKSR